METKINYFGIGHGEKNAEIHVEMRRSGTFSAGAFQGRFCRIRTILNIQNPCNKRLQNWHQFFYFPVIHLGFLELRKNEIHLKNPLRRLTCRKKHGTV